MDYVIECRLAPAFANKVPDKGLATLLSKWVLFAYSFSVDKASAENVKSIAEQSFEDAKRDMRSDPAMVHHRASLHIELDKVQVRTGSVEISLLVKGLAVIGSSVGAGPVVSVAVGALGLWAVDKIFGGALELDEDNTRRALFFPSAEQLLKRGLNSLDHLMGERGCAGKPYIAAVIAKLLRLEKDQRTFCGQFIFSCLAARVRLSAAYRLSLAIGADRDGGGRQ